MRGINSGAIDRGRSSEKGAKSVKDAEAGKSGRGSVPLFDAVSNPAHYQSGGIEAIDVIRAQLSEAEWRGYLKGSIQKYLFRMAKKGNEAQDAGKMLFYAKLLNGVDPREERGK